MACYRIKLPSGSTAFICGKLGPPCVHCGSIGGNLCDYPVGKGKTCDRSICNDCASEIGPDLHYCPPHAGEWERFYYGGGVDAELVNVVPYRRR